MSVSSEKINDAMARFLMSRYQRAVYVLDVIGGGVVVHSEHVCNDGI